MTWLPTRIRCWSFVAERRTAQSVSVHTRKLTSANNVHSFFSNGHSELLYTRWSMYSSHIQYNRVSFCCKNLIYQQELWLSYRMGSVYCSPIFVSPSALYCYHYSILNFPGKIEPYFYQQCLVVLTNDLNLCTLCIDFFWGGGIGNGKGDIRPFFPPHSLDR